MMSRMFHVKQELRHWRRNDVLIVLLIPVFVGGLLLLLSLIGGCGPVEKTVPAEQCGTETEVTVKVVDACFGTPVRDASLTLIYRGENPETEKLLAAAPGPCDGCFVFERVELCAPYSGTAVAPGYLPITERFLQFFAAYLEVQMTMTGQPEGCPL